MVTIDVAVRRIHALTFCICEIEKHGSMGSKSLPEERFWFFEGVTSFEMNWK